MSRPAPVDRSSIRNDILAGCPRLRELSMILEIAILNVRPGREDEFEAAFAQASPIIASMPGYVSHQLQHSCGSAAWIRRDNCRRRGRSGAGQRLTGQGTSVT